MGCGLNGDGGGGTEAKKGLGPVSRRFRGHAQPPIGLRHPGRSINGLTRNAKTHNEQDASHIPAPRSAPPAPPIQDHQRIFAGRQRQQTTSCASGSPTTNSSFVYVESIQGPADNCLDYQFYDNVSSDQSRQHTTPSTMAGHFDSSDFEDSLASPSKPPQPQRSKTPTNQNTRFDTQESREAALRKELDGVKKINGVIEGLIGTLERAQGNMGVCPLPPDTQQHNTTLERSLTTLLPDRLPNSRQHLHPAQHLDAHPLTDRTQPAADSQPGMEGRHPGPGGHGERGTAEAAGGGEARSRSRAAAGRGTEESRGRREEAHGGHSDVVVQGYRPWSDKREG